MPAIGRQDGGTRREFQAAGRVFGGFHVGLPSVPTMLKAVRSLLRRANSPRGQRVYRTMDVPDPQDPWELRIVQLANGRSVEELVAVLFHEELRAGAWMSDIGLWRGLFSRSVMDAVADLAERGIISLREADES